MASVIPRAKTLIRAESLPERSRGGPAVHAKAGPSTRGRTARPLGRNDSRKSIEQSKLQACPAPVNDRKRDAVHLALTISPPIWAASHGMLSLKRIFAESSVVRTELSHWHRADVVHTGARGKLGTRPRARSQRRGQGRGSHLPA